MVEAKKQWTQGWEDGVRKKLSLLRQYVEADKNSDNPDTEKIKVTTVTVDMIEAYLNNPTDENGKLLDDALDRAGVWCSRNKVVTGLKSNIKNRLREVFG